MSYETERERMEPVLKLARELDISSNPDPRALYRAGSGGIMVWCTPADHPGGWYWIEMEAGPLPRACEYVGCACWIWDDQTISSVGLALGAADPIFRPLMLVSRPLYETPSPKESLDWLRDKISWLFLQAMVEAPPFRIVGEGAI